MPSLAMILYWVDLSRSRACMGALCSGNKPKTQLRASSFGSVYWKLIPDFAPQKAAMPATLRGSVVLILVSQVCFLCIICPVYLSIIFTYFSIYAIFLHILVKYI